MRDAPAFDTSRLAEISPEMVREYLTEHGWKFGYQRPGGMAETWRKNGKGCVVPITSPAEDASYGLSLDSLLRDVARVEGCTQIDVYHGLLGEPTYDQVKKLVEAVRVKYNDMVIDACQRQSVRAGTYDDPIFAAVEKDGRLRPLSDALKALFKASNL